MELFFDRVNALKTKENESSWLYGDLAWFSKVGIFVRGNQYMFYMHFGNCQVFEKNCSIHGVLNCFFLGWNDELTLRFILEVFGKT